MPRANARAVTTNQGALGTLRVERADVRCDLALEDWPEVCRRARLRLST